MNEISNGQSILSYMHCGKCLDEIPDDISPQEWSSLEVGWTELGLQVWCKRHNCNVINIDFECHTHPANDTVTDRLLKVVK